MPTSQKIEDIIASLRQEFIETASDQLESIDTLFDKLEMAEDVSEDDMFSIPRNIHNIKGQSATFGFPTIGRIAHLLEDYLENAGGVQRELLTDMRVYLDLMAKILDDNSEPVGAEAETLLSSLPHFNVKRGYSSQKINDVQVLLAMPPGLQRKVVARELLSCGFQVIRAYDAIEAISVALSFAPDIVMVNRDFTPIDAIELSKAFASIKKLEDIHFVIFSGFDEDSSHLAETPDNVSIVVKRGDFTETLSQLFIEWGIFGELGHGPELAPEQSVKASTAPALNKRIRDQNPTNN